MKKKVEEEEEEESLLNLVAIKTELWNIYNVV